MKNFKWDEPIKDAAWSFIINDGSEWTGSSTIPMSDFEVKFDGIKFTETKGSEPKEHEYFYMDDPYCGLWGHAGDLKSNSIVEIKFTAQANGKNAYLMLSLMAG